MATGLLDIADASAEVHGVKVTGATARGVSYLLARFPELRMAMTGREVTADALMLAAPDAIASIIAVGCGFVPNGKDGDVERQKEAEAKASGLAVGIQAEFLDEIIRLTMPQGIGPFVARLEKLASFAEVGGFGPGPVTKSPPQ